MNQAPLRALFRIAMLGGAWPTKGFSSAARAKDPPQANQAVINSPATIARQAAGDGNESREFVITCSLR